MNGDNKKIGWVFGAGEVGKGVPKPLPSYQYNISPLNKYLAETNTVLIKLE
jgi:hypothetical protein